MIKALSFEEYKRLYKERVKTDFPRLERRPLSIVKKMYKRGNYVCLCLSEDGQIAAYAAFIVSDTTESVLLDLFAVEGRRRGGGVGSRFLGLLREYWQDKRGIILECERVEKAKNDTEKTVRERRIRFYLNGGAEVTPLYWRAFFVDYHVLWLPTASGGGATDMRGDLLRLYKIGLPRIAAKLFLKFKD